MAAFSLEDFKTALAAFQKGMDLKPDAAAWKTWIRKCEAELSSGKNFSETNIFLIFLGAPKAQAAAPQPTPQPQVAPKPTQQAQVAPQPTVQAPADPTKIRYFLAFPSF